MRVVKKMLRTGCLGLLLLLLLIGLALHFALQREVRRAVHGQLVPLAKRALGVDVSVGDIRTSLVRGMATVPDIKIGNPPGFSEPVLLHVRDCRVRLRLRCSRAGVVPVLALDANDATITIVRNARGEVNTDILMARLQREKPPAGGRPAAGKRKAAREPNRRLELDMASVGSRIRVIDHGTPGTNQTLVRCSMDLRGLRTYGDAQAFTGSLSLSASRQSERGPTILDLKGTLAPMLDASRPSFQIKGRARGIDPAVLTRCSPDATLVGGSASAQFTLLCRDGIFDGKKSVIRVDFGYAKNIGFSAGKELHAGVPPEMSFDIPVSGALGQQKVNWGELLSRLFLPGLTNNPLPELKAKVKETYEKITEQAP